MYRYLLDHWNGQLGFGLTLFVNLIGISFVVASINVESWPVWATIFGLIIIVLLLMWQVVGGWRCANILQLEQSANDNAWGLYVGIAVTLGLVGFQILDVVAHRFFIEPPFKTIFQNDDFSVKFNGETVELGGEVNYLMYQALVTIISQQESVKTISLDSHGGIVFAARSIAKIVEKNALDTQVEKHCYSACTMIFAAGENRTVSDRAEIGFHGYSFDMPYRFNTVDPIEEQEKDKAYLAGRGIDAVFLNQAFATNANTLWKPSHDALFQAGFTTQR